MNDLSTIASTPAAILIEGFPGAGKSTLALQFPNVAYLDCDLNVGGPARYLKSIGKDITKPGAVKYYAIPYEDDHTQEKPHIVAPEFRYDRLLTKLTEAIKDPWVKTIVPDGLTQIDTFIYHKVQKQQGIPTGQPLAIQHWRPFRDYLLTMITALRYCGKTIILPCHVESIQSEPVKGQMSTIIGYKPLISTKIGEFFAGFFTDMWLMEAKPGAQGKTDYTLRTSRHGLYQDLKNAYLMPGEIKNPTFEEVNKYLKI